MKLTLLSLGLHLVSGFIGPNPKLASRYVNSITQPVNTQALVPSRRNYESANPLLTKTITSLNAQVNSDEDRQKNEEIRKKLIRLESLAKTLTGDKSLSLEAGDSWAYKSDTNTLVFPRSDLDHISEEAAIAIIARESGHRRYTSYPAEVTHNPAFRLLFNTIEQIRINRYMSGRHLGYHPLAFLAFNQFQMANQAPGTTEPLHKQFCLGLIDQSFGKKNSPWAQSPSVKSALAEVHAFVEEATKLPIDGREMLIKGLSPEQINSSSEESFQIIKNKIWPIFQRLLDEESSQRNEQNASEDGSPSDGNSNDGSPSDGSPTGGSSNDGSPSDGSPGDGSPSEGSSSNGKPGNGNPSSDSPNSGIPNQATPGEGSATETEQQNTAAGSNESGTGNANSSMDEQNLEEIAKDLEKQWNQLSPEQQKQIQDLASELESKLGEADPNNLENPHQGKPTNQNQAENQQANKPQANEEQADNSESGESDGQAGDGQAGDGQAGDGQAGDGQAGDGQAGDGQAGDGQAGDGQAGDGQAGDGQAGDGQAGDGQAGDGQAGDGQAGDGQAGEGQAGDGQGSSEGNSQRITSDSISIVDSDQGAGGSEEGYQQHADNHQKLMEMIEEYKRRNANQNIPDSYEHYKTRNKQLIDELSEEVRHIFEDDAEPKLEGDYRSGIYNLQKAIESKARSQATGIKDDKIFMRKNHPEEKSVELVICLDTSGSMSGEAINYAKDAVVVVGEMANELKLPWGLLTFANSVDLLKSLNKSEQEHKWEQALVDADAGGGTDDYAALEKAVEMFTESESDAEKKIILFMTDGSGNYKQREFVKQIQEEGYWVIGIGIGEGTYYVSETYDRSVHVPNVEDLPLELAQLMLELLKEGPQS